MYLIRPRKDNIEDNSISRPPQTRRSFIHLSLWLSLILAIFWGVSQAPLQGTASSGFNLPLILKNLAVQPQSSDWPQYQHDAARRGANPANVSARQFDEVWHHRFADDGDGIASTAQPIIVGNSIFIGTEKGKMYAFGLSSGSELWQRQLDGGIAHTAAATQQSIFVATLAGNVYALDIQSGNTQWQFNTPGGFGGAVLLVEEQNAIYVANRLGTVHALNINTGAELWKTDLQFTILQSPAYGDGRVYIGVEDLKLYALDATNGQISWTSAQLFGRSFYDYAPVYANGKVIVNIMPDLYAYTENDFDLMKQANLEFADSSSLSDAQDATQQWLSQNPKSQTMYVFEATTGQQPYQPGVLYSVVNNGPQPPPIYANGNLYSGFHVTEPMWLRESDNWKQFVGAFLDFAALGRIDLSTGRVVEQLADTPGEFTTDETNNFSVAGDLLIGARCQTRPVCMPIAGNTSQCNVNQTTSYSFPSDLCTPGSAPIYANNHIAYQALNVLIVYQGS